MSHHVSIKYALPVPALQYGNLKYHTVSGWNSGIAYIIIYFNIPCFGQFINSEREVKKPIGSVSMLVHTDLSE